jgi:hypothetical protein
MLKKANLTTDKFFFRKSTTIQNLFNYVLIEDSEDSTSGVGTLLTAYIMALIKHNTKVYEVKDRGTNTP